MCQREQADGELSGGLAREISGTGGKAGRAGEPEAGKARESEAGKAREPEAGASGVGVPLTKAVIIEIRQFAVATRSYPVADWACSGKWLAH
jgi:hypothetical protein